jgi:hypothetical protein
MRPELWIPTEQEVIQTLGKYPTVIEENQFTPEQEVIQTLGKYPTVIEENQFTPQGFIKKDDQLLVPVYVASELGFNFPGKYFLDNWLYPKLEEVDAIVLCPFKACGEFLDLDSLANDGLTVRERRLVDTKFNQVINMVNNGILMPRAKFQFNILEGVPGDTGAASEASYFASNFGPVIGVRTDVRPGENMASGINGQVKSYMDHTSYKGRYFENPTASQDGYLEAIDYLKEEIKSLKKNYQPNRVT